MSRRDSNNNSSSDNNNNNNSNNSSDNNNNYKTGHKEFDRWREKFSSTIKEIEISISESNDATKLIRKATSILSNKMALEIHNLNVTDNDNDNSNNDQSGLKQELMDIYNACKMQIETYKILNGQKEILFQNANTNTKSKSTTMSSVTGSSSLSSPSSSPSLPSSSSSSSSSSSLLFGNSARNSVRDNINANTQGRVRKQNSQLQDALRSINESEEIANEINQDLYRQRDTLETTQSRLQQFSSMTGHAKGVLKNMNKPWWTKW